MARLLLTILCVSLGGLLLVTVPGYAQSPPKNPNTVGFTCPDHDRDDQHEIDIVREGDGVVVATLLGGDPPLVNGEVILTLNVQPIAFGRYRFVARAVAGAVKSDNSTPTEVWERVPGSPTGVRIVR